MVDLLVVVRVSVELVAVDRVVVVEGKLLGVVGVVEW